VIVSTNSGAPPASIDLATKHDFRTSLSLNLASGPSGSVPTTPDVQTWDFRFYNSSVTTASTVYWVRGGVFDTNGADTVHVVAFDAFVPAADLAYTHHILVYLCAGALSADDLLYSGSGYASSTPEALRECNGAVVLAAWAVGGSAVVLPADVGIPVTSQSYLLLEVHVNNPSLVPLQINSGIRFYYTSVLRPVVGGILYTGAVDGPFLMAPPGLASTTRTGYCLPVCTQSALPAAGVNVFAVSLHAHTAAVKLAARVISANGSEQAPLLQVRCGAVRGRRVGTQLARLERQLRLQLSESDGAASAARAHAGRYGRHTVHVQHAVAQRDDVRRPVDARRDVSHVHARLPDAAALVLRHAVPRRVSRRAR
jgi:hypothetical protein